MNFDIKFWGTRSAFGLVLATLTFLADQMYKWAMITHMGLIEGKVVKLTWFLDLVLVWNKGISYGLFPQDTALGRGVLLLVVLVTCIILLIWLAKTHSNLVASALGLLIGGAAGNALDRVMHGAVADFFSLHAYGFYWYVFNLADIAIVAGVGLLLYDSIRQHKEN